METTANAEDINVQINTRLTLAEKLALIKMARKKGVGGITGLLKLIAKAKELVVKV